VLTPPAAAANTANGQWQVATAHRRHRFVHWSN
jgi:hypothetical protein